MASDTATATEIDTGTGLAPWQAGLIGGIGGSILFGALMTMMEPGMLETMIPGMYGLEGGLAGWIVHISHGAVLGVVFAGLLVVSGRRDVAIGPSVAGGIVYGGLVWLGLAVVVMPIWLGMPEMVPNFDVGSLVGHAIYGAVLGVAFSVLSR